MAYPLIPCKAGSQKKTKGVVSTFVKLLVKHACPREKGVWTPESACDKKQLQMLSERVASRGSLATRSQISVTCVASPRGRTAMRPWPTPHQHSSNIFRNVSCDLVACIARFSSRDSEMHTWQWSCQIKATEQFCTITGAPSESPRCCPQLMP